MSGTVPKPLPVCEGCRARKIRCDFYQDICGECRKIGMECVRTPAIIFKHHSGHKSRDVQDFPARQVWTLPKTTLRYHDETPGIIDLYSADTSSYVFSQPQNGSNSALESSSNDQMMPDDHEQPQYMATTSVDSFSALKSPSSHHNSPQVSMTHAEAVLAQSPVTGSQTHVSPWAQSVDSDHAAASRLELTRPLSEMEAMLLRNYTENMALWADDTDPGRTFELEASRRALSEPVLLYAICAFSSRHMNRQQPDQDHVALEYQSLCLQLLIPAISGPQPVDESVLAAVAILRQNEEMDGKSRKSRRHASSNLFCRRRQAIPSRRRYANP